MNRIAIMTDSNSGIMPEQGKNWNIHVLAMPFTIADENYIEGINLHRDHFFQMQKNGAKISTSMPSIGELMEMWDKLLKDYEEVLYIPMSSGLSSSCQSAISAAMDYEGKVVVVDNGRVSVPQRCSVEDAMALSKQGRSAKEIKEILEREKANSETFIMVEDLKYLKQGGRITPTVAAIGTVLRIKPVLQMHGSRIDMYAKARNIEKGKENIIKALEDAMDRMDCHDPKEMRLQAAYTCSEEKAKEWINQLEEHFSGFRVDADPLPLSTACHLGPGVIAAAVTKKIPELLL